MVKLKGFFNRNKSVDIWEEPNVLTKRPKEEGYVTPYKPLSSAPVAPPATISTSVPDVANDYGGPKIDLSATYIPSSPPFSPPFPPPTYVSREPSMITAPFERPALPAPSVPYEVPAASTSYAIPAAPAPYGMPAASAPYTRPAIPETYGAPAASAPYVVPTPPSPYRAPVASAPYSQPPAPPTVTPASTTFFDHPPMPTSPAPSAPRRDAQPPPPGDLPLQRSPGEKITPEELRDLREMIRQRYQLDVQIWSERFLRERDRDITEAKIKKADALMSKIRRTVITWNDPQFFKPNTGDYEAFQEVARRIHSEGKRDWVNEPPWTVTRRGGGERRLY